MRGFLITHNDAPQSIGLLWTNDQSVAETSTWQHTNIQALGEIRDHNLGRRAAEDLRLRPRGHWDRQLWPNFRYYPDTYMDEQSTVSRDPDSRFSSQVYNQSHCRCISSLDHIITWLYHHLIISSLDYIITWSYHHLIISSLVHIITWSYHHLIISSLDPPSSVTYFYYKFYDVGRRVISKWIFKKLDGLDRSVSG